MIFCIFIAKYPHVKNSFIYVTGFEKSIPIGTIIEIQYIVQYNDALMHCQETSNTCLYIVRSAFTDGLLLTCKSVLVHYRAY